MQLYFICFLISLISIARIFSIEDYSIDNNGEYVSGDENEYDNENEINEEMTIKVYNYYPTDKIEIIWQDIQSQEDSVIVKIEPNDAGFIHTFIGHKFMVKLENNNEKHLNDIIVLPNKQTYYFGPEESKTYKFSLSDGLTPIYKKIESKIMIDNDSQHIGRNMNTNDINNITNTKNIDSKHIKKYEKYGKNMHEKIDVSLFPVVTIIGTTTTAMAAKFRCFCKAADYYYDDGKEGVFQGQLEMGRETTINTYEGKR